MVPVLDNNILHVLNGDSSLSLFQKSGIGGKTVIWREMLVEGPVASDIHQDVFWEIRSQYLDEQYGVSPTEYEEKTLTQVNQLRDLSHYGEIVLWFEYDLFCQVNLIACLSLIDHSNISLICAGDEDGQLKGLGENPPEKYIRFFRDRDRLEKWEISFTRELWTAFQENDRERLKRLSKFPPYKLRYLRPALAAYLELTSETELPGIIEKEMLMAVREGISDERSLIRHMLHWQQWYGFGDLQYIRILKKMSSYFLRDPLRLSDTGYQKISRFE